MKKKLTKLLANCFVNIPFVDFDRYEDLIREHRLNPEIGFAGEALYIFSRQEYLAKADFLAREGLICTLHAPFHDLLPGAQDRKVLQASRDKLHLCFDLIDIFRPRSIVCHLGYLEPVHSYNMEQWLETSLETWRGLVDMAQSRNTVVMFENTYEPGPAVHKIFLETLDSPAARFCLDVGHLLAFARDPWQKWLEILSPWLGQLHLHDNQGSRDDHLPVSRGRFDFAGFFSYLKTHDLNPILTLEPRSENDLWESLNALDRMGIFDHKS